MDRVGVISTIATVRGYEDRVAMLDEIGRFVGKHLVITKDEPRGEGSPAAAGHSDLALLDGAYGLRFARRAYSEARRFQARSPDVDHWIVHDYLTAWVGPRLKWRSRKPAASFLSLVFPSFTVLREKGWRLSGGKPLTIGDEMRSARLFAGRCVINYAGALASDAVVSNSAMISDEIAALPLLRKKWIRTMQTEVDTSVFYPAPSASRRNLPPRILYVGAFANIKGLPVLLRAFAEVARGGSDATLAIAGRPPSAAEMREIDAMTGGLASAGRITVLGFLDRPRLAECYNDADLLVCPSFYEGSPRVVKEAMACGLPAVVSDIPGSRLIDPDGQVLAFYDPHSERELAGRIRDALEDRPGLSRWGEETSRYVQRFSTTETARNTVRLYEEFLSARRP